MGELIVYQSLRCPCVICSSTISNIFSSETTGPIKFKFHVEIPKGAGTNVSSNGPGLMTQMASTPIYGKIFLQNQTADDLWTWYVALGL